MLILTASSFRIQPAGAVGQINNKAGKSSVNQAATGNDIKASPGAGQYYGNGG